MKFIRDEKTKNYFLLITYAILLAYVFLNLDTVWNVVVTIIDLIKPFIIGVCIAFVLNIPMKFFEEKIEYLLYGYSHDYSKIYQSVDASFDYDREFAKDTCYRNIPSVDNSLFTIARKLILAERTPVLWWVFFLCSKE